MVLDGCCEGGEDGGDGEGTLTLALSKAGTNTDSVG
jgi:hypothetical protein